MCGQVDELHGTVAQSPAPSGTPQHASSSGRFSDARMAMGFTPPAPDLHGGALGFGERADDARARGIYTPATEKPSGLL
jgi:hypothetical protein